MGDYEIIYDKNVLQSKLLDLASKVFVSFHEHLGAMCYVPGNYDDRCGEYLCPICKKTTEREIRIINELENIRHIVDEINLIDFIGEALIDEREYCQHCYGKKHENPECLFKLRLSQYGEHHIVRESESDSYMFVLLFLRGMENYIAENPRIIEYALHQLTKMTILSQDVVKEWRKSLKIEQKAMKKRYDVLGDD